MANPINILLVLLLSLLTAQTTARHHQGGLKSLRFTLFQHNTFNQTGYIIVNGVAGTGLSQTTTPFGTIFAARDNLTAGPDAATSPVLGVAEGVSVTSSFDGLRTILMATITLIVEGHRGSVSILGGTHNTKPADQPIVGGTGDFMFVQGYLRSSPVDLEGLSVVFKIEFFLYWPPYATSVPKY